MNSFIEEFDSDMYLESLESELFTNDNNDFLSYLEHYMDTKNDDSDIMTEGYNMDLGAEHKATIKEIRSALKDVKKSVKKTKNYKSAIASLDSINAKIDKIIKDIKSYDGTVSDAIYGYIYHNFLTNVKVFVLALLTLPIGGIAGIIEGWVVFINDIYMLYKNIHDAKKNGKELKPNDFNVFRNHVITRYIKIKTNIQKMKHELNEKIQDDNITDNKPDDKDVKEFAMECLEYDLTFDDSDIMTEGYNMDLNKKYKSDIKGIKLALKEVKKSVKNGGDYKDAITNLDNINKTLDNMISDVKNYKGDKNAAIIGIFLHTYISAMKIFVAGILTIPLGGIGAIVTSVKKVLEDSTEINARFAEKIKNGEEVTADDYNMYKNHIITKYKDFKDKVNKLKAEVQKKSDILSNEVKEKVNDFFENEKLRLYEACGAGEITEDQREALLERFRTASKVEESVQMSNISDYSNKDAFNAIKLNIYERCASGEFDVATREDLIKEAYQRFMEGEDSTDKIIDSVKKSTDTTTKDGNKLMNDLAKV